MWRCCHAAPRAYLDGTMRALRQIEAVRAQRSAPLNVLVVPTRVDGRTIEGRQLVDQLRALGEIVTRPMTSRVDYVRAFTAGLSVHAPSPRGRAGHEEQQRGQRAAGTP